MSEQAPIKRLPSRVEPRKLVNAQAHFQRYVDAEDLPRLSDVALSITYVEVDISFLRDEQHRPELRGSIKAAFELECQRCLEPMTLEVSRDFVLAIVWDEAQAKALPKDTDPWIVGEDEEDLSAILEEEILLELPVVASHDEDCLKSEFLSTGGEPEEEVSDKPNPFSVLIDLKDKK